MHDAIGIDLGTTYSVVAIVDADFRPKVIPDDQGRPTTPSVIAFETDTPIVGYDAKDRQSLGSSEIAAFFKRSMGDQHFALSFRGRDYTPVDLSALVLAHLKSQAEQFLGRSVTKSVITVPAYFTHSERQATIDAGRQAGLQVLSIISEPTAAALAYGMRPSAVKQLVLVYDLGGGTFDCSLVEITDLSLRVLGVSGDHNLGGKDWDDRLVRHLQGQFMAEFGDDPLSGDGNVQELLVQVEQLKRSLSARQSAEIRMRANGHTLLCSVTRRQFDDLCQDLVSRTVQLVEQVLGDADLSWNDVDGVIPVGGATRMPMIREAVEHVSGKSLMGGVNPDEAVALGAALQAAIDSGNVPGPSVTTWGLRERKQIHDVIAHSLGMIAESEDRSRYVNSVLIRKNMPIPSKQTRPYIMQLKPGGDTILEVFLTQGETSDPQECAYLGRYTFTNFPAGGPAEVILDIEYEYDGNGVVHISASERATGAILSLHTDRVPANVPARFRGKPGGGEARVPLSVYLAFDVSGSMSGEPIAQARKAAESFVSQCDLTTTTIGLISFSDSVHVDLLGTHNATEIALAISHLRECSTGGGNSGHPFDKLFELLDRAPGRRYAVVLADGVWSYQERAIEQARRCHKAGIEIVAIGFGGADRDFLARIASSSEQSVLTTGDHLTEAFRTIARELTEGGNQRTDSRLRNLKT